ncbi:MAG: hypothetical protein HQ564_04350 [Candidatus Saganbacteria bacterium]|nr:hypothetical protein [Candidatus Saganbacteria bacterium]
MIKRILFAALFVFLMVSVSSAAQFLGGDIRLSFNLDYQTLGLNDAGDSVYIGDITVGNSIGFGGRADVVYAYSDLLDWGWNFDFTYASYDTSLYSLTTINPSIGPLAKLKFGKNALLFSANYNLGYVSTQQEAAGAAGSFVANTRGWLITLRGLFPVWNNVALGPYVTYAPQVFYAFKYKSGSTFQWVDIGTTTMTYGLSVYI